MEGLARSTLTLRLLIRFSAMGFSVLVPLLGAATAALALSARQLLALMGTAITLHIFGYVLNDLIDLPVDRLETRRKDYPLVRGSLGRVNALGFALLNLCLAFLFARAVTVEPAAWALLGAATAAGTAYNLWGKHFRFPIVADALQALAWTALFWFGVRLEGNPSAPLAPWIGAFIFVYALQANGVHGGLRDLEGDQAGRANSTALWFGARSRSGEGPSIPASLALYALGLQLVLVTIGLTAALLEQSHAEHRPALMPVLQGVLGGASLVLLALMTRKISPDHLSAAGLFQLAASLGMPLALVAGSVSHPFLALLLLWYVLPVLTHSALYTGLAGAARAIRDLALGHRHVTPADGWTDDH